MPPPLLLKCFCIILIVQCILVTYAEAFPTTKNQHDTTITTTMTIDVNNNNNNNNNNPIEAASKRRSPSNDTTRVMETTSSEELQMSGVPFNTIQRMSIYQIFKNAPFFESNDDTLSKSPTNVDSNSSSTNTRKLETESSTSSSTRPFNITGLFKGNWSIPLSSIHSPHSPHSSHSSQSNTPLPPSSSSAKFGFDQHTGAVLYHIHVFTTSDIDIHLVKGSMRMRDGQYPTDPGNRYSLFGLYIWNQGQLYALAGSPSSEWTNSSIHHIAHTVSSTQFNFQLIQAQSKDSNVIYLYKKYLYNAIQLQPQLFPSSEFVSFLSDYPSNDDHNNNNNNNNNNNTRNTMNDSKDSIVFSSPNHPQLLYLLRQLENANNSLSNTSLLLWRVLESQSKIVQKLQKVVSEIIMKEELLLVAYPTVEDDTNNNDSNSKGESQTNSNFLQGLSKERAQHTSSQQFQIGEKSVYSSQLENCVFELLFQVDPEIVEEEASPMESHINNNNNNNNNQNNNNNNKNKGEQLLKSQSLFLRQSNKISTGSAALDSDNDGVIESQQLDSEEEGDRIVTSNSSKIKTYKSRTFSYFRDSKNSLASSSSSSSSSWTFSSQDITEFETPRVVFQGGIFSIAPCGDFRIESTASTVNLQIYYDKATNYVTVVVLFSIFEIYLIGKQYGHSSTQTRLAKVSLITIGAQAILDSYLCLIHLTVGVLFENMLQVFISASFVKFLQFSVFEMRYVVAIWKARRPDAFNNGWEQIRRELSSIYTRFYVALSVGLVVIFLFNRHFRLFMFLLYSFWVPQIVTNIIRGTNNALDYRYILGTSLSRLMIPLYFYSCPYNVVNAPNNIVSGWLCFWIALQVGVLYLQDQFGSRFLIPSIFLPKSYDYYKHILFSKYPSYDVEKGKMDCVVCMNEIPFSKRAYMVTPCNHVFHRECLHRWMDVKLECPTCRQPLPIDVTRSAWEIVP